MDEHFGFALKHFCLHTETSVTLLNSKNIFVVNYGTSFYPRIRYVPSTVRNGYGLDGVRKIPIPISALGYRPCTCTTVE